MSDPQVVAPPQMTMYLDDEGSLPLEVEITIDDDDDVSVAPGFSSLAAGAESDEPISSTCAVSHHHERMFVELNEQLERSALATEWSETLAKLHCRCSSESLRMAVRAHSELVALRCECSSLRDEIILQQRLSTIRNESAKSSEKHLLQTITTLKNELDAVKRDAEHAIASLCDGHQAEVDAVRELCNEQVELRIMEAIAEHSEKRSAAHPADRSGHDEEGTGEITTMPVPPPPTAHLAQRREGEARGGGVNVKLCIPSSCGSAQASSVSLLQKVQCGSGRAASAEAHRDSILIDALLECKVAEGSTTIRVRVRPSSTTSMTSPESPLYHFLCAQGVDPNVVEDFSQRQKRGVVHEAGGPHQPDDDEHEERLISFDFPIHLISGISTGGFNYVADSSDITNNATSPKHPGTRRASKELQRAKSTDSKGKKESCLVVTITLKHRARPVCIVFDDARQRTHWVRVLKGLESVLNVSGLEDVQRENTNFHYQSQRQLTSSTAVKSSPLRERLDAKRSQKELLGRVRVLQRSIELSVRGDD